MAMTDQDNATPVTIGQMQTWMEDYVRSVIHIPEGEFPADDRFDQIGLDSVEVTIMAGMIEERYAVQVEPSEVMENPSVRALSKHLVARLNAG